uniref:Maf-like protein n=1 Tax=Solanum lycopersicum TaxID=4081 RepID=A0A3Q7GAY2_SOLLC
MEANAPQFKLILGSSSTARKKILGDMGYEFTTMSADIDEKAIRKEKPEDLVMALAEAKADAIISKFRKTENPEKVLNPTILVAADTAEAIIPRVSIGESEGDAEPTLLITCDQVYIISVLLIVYVLRCQLPDYANGHAATVSSVLVTNLTTGSRRGEWDKVEIYFHDIPDQVIDKLIEEGIVLYAAGGLIIEHPLVLPYIKEVVGSTDSVMGLPKALTERLIKEVL